MLPLFLNPGLATKCYLWFFSFILFLLRLWTVLFLHIHRTMIRSLKWSSWMSEKFGAQFHPPCNITEWTQKEKASPLTRICLMGILFSKFTSCNRVMGLDDFIIPTIRTQNCHRTIINETCCFGKTWTYIQVIIGQPTNNSTTFYMYQEFRIGELNWPPWL